MKAVIFDLDGTLLDTLEDIAISVNAVLNELGKEPIEVSRFRYLVGEGALQLMKNAMPNEEESYYHNALELFEKHYAKQYAQNTKMYEGISKVLTYLQVKGVHLTVLSNKPDSFTKKCVLKYLRNWDFGAVYGVRENIPRKPAPEGVYDILEDLHVKAEEVVFIGDTKVDMQTAKAANITSIGVLWGFRDEEELRENGADFIAKTPSELIKILETLESR